MSILQIAGPRGVGTSSVAWELYMRVVGSGVRTGYIDLAQLQFHRPLPSGATTAHNLGVVWQTYQAAGARALIVAGWPADPLPGARLCWLHASHDRLVERLVMRGRGYGPPVPGDALCGLPEGRLRRLARSAPAPSAAEFVVDTDGLDVRGAVDALCDQLGEWSSA